MGSRLTYTGVDKVYDATLWWVRYALQSDGSLFTPGKEIWSGELLTQVRRNVLDNLDTGKGSFWKKLHKQLKSAGSPPEAYQLMAEALYVYYIAIIDVTYPTKANNIRRVLWWSDQPSEYPDYLGKSLSSGISRFGESKNRIRFNVSFLIEFAEKWKQQEHGIRDEILKYPWVFKKFAKGKKPSQQREALLHLIFPDTFEAIVSVGHKEKIARSFPEAFPYTFFDDVVEEGTDDVDHKLQQIREYIERQIGSRDHLFYKPIIRRHWDK